MHFISAQGVLTDLWLSLHGSVWSHPRPVESGSWRLWRYGRAPHCRVVALALEKQQEDSALSVRDCQGWSMQACKSKWWQSTSTFMFVSIIYLIAEVYNFWANIITMEDFHNSPKNVSGIYLCATHFYSATVLWVVAHGVTIWLLWCFTIVWFQKTCTETNYEPYEPI